MLLHLHPKSSQNPIHTSPPSHPSFSPPSSFSPSHTFSPPLPRVFLFTPPPLKHPSPHPKSSKISLPTLISHTQIPPCTPVTSPHHIILPWLSPKSSPNPPLYNPKYVKTILPSLLTIKTILDFSPKIVYNMRISTTETPKFQHKIHYFKGDLSMSTEQLQQIQPLIQSNPELKTQLVNYLAVDRVLNIAPFIVLFIFSVMFAIYVVSVPPNEPKLLYKILISLTVITVIACLLAYVSTPFIAPDIYLQLQMK